jgi:hypothetical protein
VKSLTRPAFWRAYARLDDPNRQAARRAYALFARDPHHAERIVLPLDHGREISIRREDVSGSDEVALYCGIERPNQAANGRFVVRASNFGCLLLTVEQLK